MICAFCPAPVDTDNSDNYVEVSSWVNGPKLDGPKLREHTGRVAHKKCVENLVSGQAPDQPELFGPDEPDLELTSEIDRADSMGLTDEPGKITKLTGPSSVHSWIQARRRDDQ